jgi:hypothetical protein
MTRYVQDLLFPSLAPAGPRGFPICGDCRAEGIGPATPWCVKHWTPERDPEGAAHARRLGLLPREQAATA